MRKSASIDSLTASIQCASSMMNSAGVGARQRHGVDQRGQPAPPRIRVDLGQRHVGVGDAQQIIEQQQILRVGVGRYIARNCARAASPSRSATPLPARSSRVTA